MGHRCIAVGHVLDDEIDRGLIDLHQAAVIVIYEEARLIISIVLIACLPPIVLAALKCLTGSKALAVPEVTRRAVDNRSLIECLAGAEGLLNVGSNLRFH